MAMMVGYCAVKSLFQFRSRKGWELGSNMNARMDRSVRFANKRQGSQQNFRYDTIMTSPSHSNMSCRHVRAAPGRGGATEHLGRPGLWMGRPTRS